MDRNYLSVLYYSSHVLSRDFDHFHDKRHYHRVSCGNSIGQGIIFSLMWLLNDVFEKYMRHFTYTVFKSLRILVVTMYKRNLPILRIFKLELPHYDDDVCDKNV